MSLVDELQNDVEGGEVGVNVGGDAGVVARHEALRVVGELMGKGLGEGLDDIGPVLVGDGQEVVADDASCELGRNRHPTTSDTLQSG